MTTYNAPSSSSNQPLIFTANSVFNSDDFNKPTIALTQASADKRYLQLAATDARYLKTSGGVVTTLTLGANLTLIGANKPTSAVPIPVPTLAPVLGQLGYTIIGTNAGMATAGLPANGANQLMIALPYGTYMIYGQVVISCSVSGSVQSYAVSVSSVSNTLNTNYTSKITNVGVLTTAAPQNTAAQTITGIIQNLTASSVPYYLVIQYTITSGSSTVLNVSSSYLTAVRIA
jgi:hypothetical protein